MKTTTTHAADEQQLLALIAQVPRERRAEVLTKLRAFVARLSGD